MANLPTTPATQPPAPVMPTTVPTAVGTTFAGLTPEQKAASNVGGGSADAFNQQVKSEQAAPGGNKAVGPINQDVAMGNLAMKQAQAPVAPAATQPTPATTPPPTTQPDATGGQPDASGGINGQLNAANQSIIDANNARAQQIDTQSTARDAAIASIENGTTPLTPAEQSQVDALKAQSDQLRQEQINANNNLQGGIQVSNARNGTAEFANTIAAGQLNQAISDGIRKVQALDAKASMAMNDLTTAIKNNDIKAVQDAYASWDKASQEKTDAITKAGETMTTALKDQRDFNQKADQFAQQQELAAKQFADKVAQDQVVNQLDAAKFAHQQAQDAADLKIKQGQLSLDAWYKQQDIALKKMVSGPSSGGTYVTMNPTTGQPNTAKQTAFLSQLDPNTASLVKKIAEYKQLPQDISTRSNQRIQIMALVHQYDPSYNELNAKGIQQYLSSWTSGALNTQRIAINTVAQHLNELKQAQDALQNVQLGGVFGILTHPANTAANAIKDASGNPAVSNYLTVANKVASELAKSYKGGASPTDVETEKERILLQLNNSPLQGDGVIQTTLGLLGGQVQSMRDNYTQNVGTAPKDTIFAPGGRSALQSLSKNGIDFNVNQIDPSTSFTSLQDLAAAHPEPAMAQQVQQARNTIQQIAPGTIPTEQEILNVMGLYPTQ